MKITANEAKKYLFQSSRKISGKLSNQRAKLGIMVTTRVRGEILTDTEQGRITIDGTVKLFKFESMGGGVWLMTVGNIDYKKRDNS